MARRRSSARRPIASFAPFFLSLVTAVVVALVLFAGSRPNFLDNLSFLKVDMADFKLPAKLASSQFLQDLSSVSGSDLVGEDTTARSLGLAPKYTVALLGSCAHGDATTCTPPLVGYAFDPRRDLRLDNTALAGTYKGDLVEAMDKYSRLSRYIAVGYVACFALSLLAPIAAIVSSRVGRAGFSAVVMSWLATVLVFAASVTTIIVFKEVNSAINANFKAVGIKSSVGTVRVLSWVAFSLSLLSSIAFFSFGGGRATGRGSNTPRSLDAKGDSRALATGVSAATSVPRPGFLQRIQTWRGQKYVQIEKQPVIIQTNDRGVDSEVLMDPMDGRTGVIDVGEEDITNRGQQSGSIPLMPLGNKRTKDLNTAYEPYARQT